MILIEMLIASSACGVVSAGLVLAFFMTSVNCSCEEKLKSLQLQLISIRDEISLKGKDD